MLCYRCHTEMKKSDMEGVLVDKCDNCKGIWLDAGELEMLVYDEKKDRDTLLTEAKQELTKEKRRLFTATEMCPKCQKVALYETRNKGIEVDQCPNCHGVFFDWGELSQVIAGHKDSKVSSVKGFLRGLFGGK